VNQVFALADAGRLADADRLGTIAAEVAATDRIPIAQIWFAINLGRIAGLQGRLATGRNRCVEGANLAEVNGFAGPQRMGLGGVAHLSAMLGDVATAQDALTRRDALPMFGFLGPEQMLADAWVAVAAGRRSDAVAILEPRGGRCGRNGARNRRIVVLHDLVRIAGATGSATLSGWPSSRRRAIHPCSPRGRTPRRGGCRR